MEESRPVEQVEYPTHLIAELLDVPPALVPEEKPVLDSGWVCARPTTDKGADAKSAAPVGAVVVTFDRPTIVVRDHVTPI